MSHWRKRSHFENWWSRFGSTFFSVFVRKNSGRMMKRSFPHLQAYISKRFITCDWLRESRFTLIRVSHNAFKSCDRGAYMFNWAPEYALSIKKIIEWTRQFLGHGASLEIPCDGMKEFCCHSIFHGLNPIQLAQENMKMKKKLSRSGLYWVFQFFFFIRVCLGILEAT